MVYRAFVEYLRARRPPRPIPKLPVTIPPLLFLLSTLYGPTRALAPLMAGLAIALMVFLASLARRRTEAEQVVRGEREEEAWLDTLAEFLAAGQLEERSHPAVAEDLEACAQLRQQIRNALNSDDWARLSKKPAWAEVRETCAESAERLLEEAVWASRDSFRKKGGRKETFRKRCEDPNFATRQIHAVRIVRTQLEHLYDSVSDDPFAALDRRDALERAQAELQAIREAEAELRAL